MHILTMKAWSRPLAVLILAAMIATVPWSVIAQNAPSGGEIITRITSAKLTPDGSWLGYMLVPSSNEYGARVKGEVVVALRSTRDDTERQFSAGDLSDGAGALAMSPSGRWIGFLSAEPGARLSLSVVEVATGHLRTIPGIRAFAFAGGDPNELLVLEGYPQTDAALAPVTITSPSDDSALATLLAASYRLNGGGTRLVWSDSAGLHVLTLPAGPALDLDLRRDATYQNFAWSPDGKALAIFRGDTLLAATGLDTDHPILRAVAPGEPGLLPGHPPDPSGRITWRDDDNAVFFEVRPPAAPPPPNDAVGNLLIWNVRDPKTPQLKAFEQQYARPFLAVYRIDDRRAIQLSDSSLIEVIAERRGRFALGYDDRPYDLPSSDGKDYRDYYLVDLATGGRRLVEKKVLVDGRRFPMNDEAILSPDGRFVVHRARGNVISYEIATGRRRNLTAKLPTLFYAPEGRRNARRAEYHSWLTVIQGWSADGRYLLLSDYRDVWAVPLAGGTAVNLTGDGWRKNIIYQYLVFDQWDGSTEIDWYEVMHHREIVDLTKPVWFDARYVVSGRAGLGRRDPSTRRTTIRHWEAAALRGYLKAARADVIAVTRETATAYPNYFLVDESGRPRTQLTFANQALVGGSGSRVFHYRTRSGDYLRASLQLPADTPRPKRGYPCIVEIYEDMGDNPNDYIWPGNVWLTSGYALLRPSIRPRLGNGGIAALESVTEAVKAAVASGLVDPKRIGLTGHSHGGYETFFIVTQTNLFKAAVPMAGITDLISGYGDLYTAGREPLVRSTTTHRIYETNQPYIGAPWWKDWNGYLRNSPLFHVRKMKTPLLIVSGDDDFAVPFHHSVEIFIALQRMGKKDVALLQYRGADHLDIEYQTSNPTGLDVRARMVQFFDHFLKGAPAPDWWSSGISYPLGRAPAPKSGI